MISEFEIESLQHDEGCKDTEDPHEYYLEFHERLIWPCKLLDCSSLLTEIKKVFLWNPYRPMNPQSSAIKPAAKTFLYLPPSLFDSRSSAKAVKLRRTQCPLYLVPYTFSIILRFTKILSMHVPSMAELSSTGESPEILFWVGCAGSFDQRAQKITRAFASILDKVGIKFAILGNEEMCNGDPARRAGNEFLFQMMAYQNIQTLNNYNIKKIVTACPHCFNILKNEYSKLGGNYEVIHHTSFLQQLIDEGKIRLKEGGIFKGRRITYHDSCYLGRGNDIYEAPRKVLEALDAELVEMKRCRSNGLCCGAGGAQMFKEEEPGSTRVNWERTGEAIDTGASIIAAACPFCNTMLTDGVKTKEKEDKVQVLDIAELIEQSLQTPS